MDDYEHCNNENCVLLHRKSTQEGTKSTVRNNFTFNSDKNLLISPNICPTNIDSITIFKQTISKILTNCLSFLIINYNLIKELLSYLLNLFLFTILTIYFLFTLNIVLLFYFVVIHINHFKKILKICYLTKSWENKTKKKVFYFEL